MTQCTCGSQRTLCKNKFSLSIMWAPRVALGLSSLLASMLPGRLRMVFGAASLTRLFFPLEVWFLWHCLESSKVPQGCSTIHGHSTPFPPLAPFCGVTCYRPSQLLLDFFVSTLLTISNNIISCFLVFPSYISINLHISSLHNTLLITMAIITACDQIHVYF